MGLGIEQNCEKTIELYKLAIGKNDCDAIWELAIMYTKGNEEYELNCSCPLDVHQNYMEATKLYVLGVKMGNSNCMYKLGRIFESGNATEKELDEAYKLYNLAIEHGNCDAMIYLAYKYMSGNSKVKQYYKKAIVLYDLAIKQGDADAMNCLAVMYDNGSGIEKNYHKAIELYELAIEQNNSMAMKNLAYLYFEHLKDYNMYAKYIVQYCESKQISLSNFIDLSKTNIVWEPYLHKHWPNKKDSENKIMVLLLISKNRKESKHNYVKYAVKGIMMIMIKYLVTFDKEICL